MFGDSTIPVFWAAKYSIPQPGIRNVCLQTEFLMLTGVCLPSTPSSINNAFYLTNNKSSTQHNLPLKDHMHLSSTCYKPSISRPHNFSLQIYAPYTSQHTISQPMLNALSSQGFRNYHMTFQPLYTTLHLAHDDTIEILSD